MGEFGRENDERMTGDKHMIKVCLDDEVRRRGVWVELSDHGWLGTDRRHCNPGERERESESRRYCTGVRERETRVRGGSLSDERSILFPRPLEFTELDRKSTRLNSSH